MELADASCTPHVEIVTIAARSESEPFCYRSTLGLKEPEFYLTLICIGVLFVVSLLKYKGMHIRETLAKQGLWFRWLIYILAILAILNLGVYGPGFDASQFIYFQF